MFRFTRKPSSGRHGQYLAKITHLVKSGHVELVQDVVSVVAAYCDLWGVCTLHCVRIYCDSVPCTVWGYTLTLFSNWQKESWLTFEETSGYVRQERVNKWPNSMTDIWWWWWWWWHSSQMSDMLTDRNIYWKFVSVTLSSACTTLRNRLKVAVAIFIIFTVNLMVACCRVSIMRDRWKLKPFIKTHLSPLRQRNGVTAWRLSDNQRSSAEAAPAVSLFNSHAHISGS
jgi:hypothetical protein